MPRLLIVGASGFVGRHVVELARTRADMHVITEPSPFEIRDAAAVEQLVRQARPDRVLHLAAQSSVAQSLAAPRETWEVNLMGTVNLLHALTSYGFNGRLVYVSSADVYGIVAPQALPIRESQTPQPTSPYAASKLAAEIACRAEIAAHGLDVVIARPFNHIGPGQDARFAVASFAQQIAMIAASAQAIAESGEAPAAGPVLHVGDLSVQRDFCDVRDVAFAYFRLFEAAESGATYNICSGTAQPLQRIVQMLIAASGIEISVQTDTARLRSVELPITVGDNTKIGALGWSPRFALEQTLADILADAQSRLHLDPARQ